ncbi:hypothetical protein D3C73_1155810 [compost metagenome]
MGSIVELMDGIPLKWSEPAKLHTGILHTFNEPKVYLAAAKSIHEYADIDATVSFFRKCMSELCCNFTAPIDIRKKKYGFFSFGNSFEHCREYLISICQYGDAIVMANR